MENASKAYLTYSVRTELFNIMVYKNTSVYFPVNLIKLQVSKYVAFSGPYIPVFGLNTGKNGPEKTPYLDTFHAVVIPPKIFTKKTLTFGK